MADRIKVLVQKRTSLKSQITNLDNILDKGKLDNTSLKLRMTRLRELYHAYEGHNDELEVLDPNNGHQAEFTNLQDRFYALAGRIENTLNMASTSDTSSNMCSDIVNTGLTNPVKKRRIKLPEAPLLRSTGNMKTGYHLKTRFTI